MDGFTNSEPHSVDPTQLPLGDNILYDLIAPADFAFISNAVDETITLPDVIDCDGNPLLFEPVNSQDIPYFGEPLLTGPYTGGFEGGYPFLGVLGDQGSISTLSTQSSSLGGYAESSNPCLSPNSLRSHFSPTPLHLERIATVGRHGGIENRTGQLRELLPRPPGLAASNELPDKVQPIAQESTRKARAKGNASDRARAPSGVKRTSQDNGTKSHPCTCCGTVLANSKTLQRHYRVYHRDFAKDIMGLKTVFKCPVSGCPKEFTREDNLGRHKTDKHSWLR